MLKKSLLSSVAIAALMACAPSAFAQTAVTQNATNDSPVANVGTENVDQSDFGLGASVAVGATGALTSTSVTGLNQQFNDPIDGFADIKQTSTNKTNSDVTNNGTINIDSGSKTNAGSSVSISANGALASFSVLAVGYFNNDNFSAAAAGDITQRSKNSTDVSNTASFNLGGITLTGNGSSVSASSGGAITSVAVTGIDALSFSMAKYGDISQTSTNESGGPVTNTVTSNISTGDLDGAGSSVSTGASGATAAVGATFINTGTVNGTKIDSITQNAKNSADVTNTLSPSYVDITTIQLDGHGTSVSASASGAVASVGFTNISVTTATAMNLGDIKQTATNTSGADVANGTTGSSITTGNLDGDGSSVSASATGAVAAVGFTNINTNAFAGPIGGANITQTAKSEGGNVTNTVPSITVNGLNGAGAAVSGSATGTLASLSFGTVSSKASSGFSIGTVTQSSNNNMKITNTTSSVNTTDHLNGNGTSVSSGASGAVASTAVSNIDSTGKNSTIASVKQTATNNTAGDVTNSASTLNIDGGSGDLIGDGSSASVSANGALAALSISSINSDAARITISSTDKSIVQTSTNKGTVTNTNGIINMDDLTGVGTSAVVSATGAASSLSVSSIADTTLGSVDINGSITQTATNYSNSTVSNTGTINAGSITGAGASVSISAVGAGSFASFHAVK